MTVEQEFEQMLSTPAREEAFWRWLAARSVPAHVVLARHSKGARVRLNALGRELMKEVGQRPHAKVGTVVWRLLQGQSDYLVGIVWDGAGRSPERMHESYVELAP